MTSRAHTHTHTCACTPSSSAVPCRPCRPRQRWIFSPSQSLRFLSARTFRCLSSDLFTLARLFINLSLRGVVRNAPPPILPSPSSAPPPPPPLQVGVLVLVTSACMKCSQPVWRLLCRPGPPHPPLSLPHPSHSQPPTPPRCHPDPITPSFLSGAPSVSSPCFLSSSLVVPLTSPPARRWPECCD